VFVFDGGAPALKRQTILGRKKRREGRREDAVRTAGRLLAVQMKRRGEEEEEKRKRDRDREKAGLRNDADEEEPLPKAEDMVYVGEMGMSSAERQQNRKFRKTDAYHLPDLTNGIEGMGQPNDPRIMSAEELEEYARQFHNGEDVNLYDFSKIDFNGEFFLSLPAGDRYNILNAARLRSRLRMGLSKEQLEDMFPDRMAFSRFQIERVRERNELTQRLMNLNGMNGEDGMFGVGGGRIAGERGREYVLVKNNGVEGGWALGVVSTEKGAGERERPIDVDALHQEVKMNEDEESEEDFEDIPVEGLNRLPKAKARLEQNLSYNDFQARELAKQRRQIYSSRNGESSKLARLPSEEPGSLFVGDDDGPPLSNGRVFDEEEEDLNRAIAMSLQDDIGESDDEEHLNQAIALSLQKNHHHAEPEGDEDFEDVPMPEFEQKPVQDPKPITSSSGGMIAHIVNNRANAAVPKRKAVTIDSDSDSEMDLQSALAKARKQKAPEKRTQPAPVASNTKNPFDGPLPFEKLDLGSSIFSKKRKAPEKATSDAEEGSEDDLAGGFDNSLEEEAPRPLPPWMVGKDDIRSQVAVQREKDLELDAEDRERAEDEEREYRRKHAPIEIESSDNESDVEIVDAPPPRKSPTANYSHVAEDVRAEPPVSDMPQDRRPSVEPAVVQQEDQATEGRGSEDEEVEWSESDYGDAITKSGKAVDAAHSAGGRKDADAARSRSASPEFEDVEMLEVNGNTQRASSLPKSKSLSPLFEDINLPDSTAAFPSELTSSTSKPAQLPVEDSFDRQQAEIDAEMDDFSDPDDEELLAQLAIEAEEHARFASTLNNKSELENQESYERELKALRNQQKKDRRDADEVSQIMITECQALLRLFGLPYITAPMEAEAQCAELVRLGLVDGVVTDDCDIFLFGGTRVYKNMFNSNKFVECYLSTDIEKELSLSRDQMITIAHLLGSDYTEGLPGIGPVTALEILSEFPSASGLQEFKDWWSSVQVNSQPPAAEKSTFRKKFRRSQATKLFLPPAFPSPAVTEAYLKPDVDSTPEPFQWGVPDLDRLREFLMATIGWSQERTDEVLVPVIRDMNRRELEGTQSNITRYFDGAVGVGAASAVGRDKVGSRRMKEAVNKLKEKKKGAGNEAIGGQSRTFADEAVEWAKHNDLSWTAREQEKLGKKSGKGKGKRKAPTTSLIEEGEETAGGAVEVEVEADDESASGEEYRELRTKGKSKSKSTAKRKRTKA